MTLLQAAKYLWAAPCSCVGLVLACIPLALGGSMRSRRGAIEVTLREKRADCGEFAQSLHFRGIVFGHVIIAVAADELQVIGPHERVHVSQYERWGLLFFPAYALSSLWQLLRGRHPYRDNCFEVEARKKASAAEAELTAH